MATEAGVMAEGLGFVEGPIAMADGSVIVVSLSRGALLRVHPDGSHDVVATPGGSPNGAAIGPDGRCYVANSGGFRFHQRDGIMHPGLPSGDYANGWIDAIDLKTGAIQRLYDRCGDRTLKGPNDLVFSPDGSFWFTDTGRVHRDHEDRGAVYWARADGSEIRLVAAPLEKPNGIGLSPDGHTLYVVETVTARLWAYDVVAPGSLRCHQRGAPFAIRRCVAGLPGYRLLDSLAVQANGDICVADIPSAVTTISPVGEVVSQMEVPDEIPTNICFGGSDMKDAFVTLSSTGRLYRLRWPNPGLRLAFNG
jgi:gluconolactonase